MIRQGANMAMPSSDASPEVVSRYLMADHVREKELGRKCDETNDRIRCDFMRQAVSIFVANLIEVFIKHLLIYWIYESREDTRSADQKPNTNNQILAVDCIWYAQGFTALVSALAVSVTARIHRRLLCFLASLAHCLSRAFATFFIHVQLMSVFAGSFWCTSASP